MGQNSELIAALAAPVFQPLDLGAYATEYAGKVLQVQVNPPAIIDEIARHRAEDEPLPRATIVIAVATFIAGRVAETRDQIAQWDDAILFWVFGQCMDLYTQYHEALRKN